MSCSIHRGILIFFYDIVNTVHGCVRKCILVKKHSEHPIVGWNKNVKHYHVIARSEFKFWKQNNIPRNGVRAMSTARARFKYAPNSVGLMSK